MMFDEIKQFGKLGEIHIWLGYDVHQANSSMRFFITYLLLFLIPATAAQEFALMDLSSSGHKMEWIDIESGDLSVHSFIVYPDSLTVAPVIIILHGEFGLTEWMMSFADQLASEKYIAIVPDLLTGKSPGKGNSRGFRNWGHARDNLLKMNNKEIMARIDLVVEYINELPAAGEVILIAGLGWGGSQVFNYLLHNQDLDAGLVFYGIAPKKKKQLSLLSTPIYGFYGEYDSRTNRNLWSTDKKMKQLGKDFYPVVYDFGGHGFMRSGERPNANEGNIKARTAAWKRLRQLLAQYYKN